MRQTDRPYVFCHMETSLDGKIMGNYMDTEEGDIAGEVFYNIAFGEHPYYKHQGWLSGRVTTDDNFTFYEKPNVDENAPTVPEGDYIPELHDMYYVSYDPSGKLAWKDKVMHYSTTTAYVLEILTERASNGYKAMLRKLGIPYIICGKENIDNAMALKKLKDIFGIELLMLGGGGVLNWSLIQDGLCDELSLVIAPSADGSTTTPTLFSAREGLTEDKAVGFELINCEVKEGSTLWLRYKVKNAR